MIYLLAAIPLAISCAVGIYLDCKGFNSAGVYWFLGTAGMMGYWVIAILLGAI